MFNTPGCQLILNTFKRCRFDDTKYNLLTKLVGATVQLTGVESEAHGRGSGGEGIDLIHY